MNSQATVMKPRKIHGELGVLEYDLVEDKVRCHVCGRWRVYLAPHLRWYHDLTPDEYREEFGLNMGQPLCTPTLSEKHRRTAIAHDLGSKSRCFNLFDYPHPTEKRLQCRLKMTETRTGMPLGGSDRRKQAQKRNYQKSLVPKPCVECGTLTLVREARTDSPVCEKCRPAHKKKINRLWADANRERLREYWREYDLKRSPRKK